MSTNLEKTRKTLLDKIKDGNVDYAIRTIKRKNFDPSFNDNQTLIEASKFGRTVIVKSLIQNAKVRAGKRLDYAYVEAAENDHVEIVKLLIESNIGIDPLFVENIALIKAAENNHVNVVKYLLNLTNANGDKIIDPAFPDNNAFNVASDNDCSDVLKVLISDPRVKVDMYNNRALFNAINFDNIEIFKLLLNDSRINAGAKDSKALVDAVRRKNIEIVRLLLKNDNINPAALNNSAFTEAIRMGDIDIIRLLLKDTRIDPAVQNHYAILYSVDKERIPIVKLLLNDPRINPNTYDGEIMRLVTRTNNVELFEILLLDGRADPSARNNNALLNTVTHNIDMFIMLLKDKRVSTSVDYDRLINYVMIYGDYYMLLSLLSEYMVNPNNTNNFAISSIMKDDEYKKLELLFKHPLVDVYNIIPTSPKYDYLLIERKNKDKHFDVVFSDEHLSNPIDVLKYTTRNRDYLTFININYIFNCLTEEQFDKVIDSDISDEYMVYFFSNINNVKYVIKNKKRLTTQLLINMRDKNSVIEHVKIYNDLINIFVDYGMEDKFLLQLYRNVNFSQPLNREYQLADIIGREDVNRLYEYVLNGGYLPYEKHERSKKWLELTDKEKDFISTYRYPSKYHDAQLSTFTKLENDTWKFYIYGDYKTFNEKLRTSTPLDKDEVEVFTRMATHIISSKPINKHCIVYRGIRLDDFNYSDNDTVVWNAFSSCSSVKEIADAFHDHAKCCMFIIKIPVGALLLDITTLKNSEFEVVMAPGAILKIVEHRGDNIILEYVGYATDDGPYYFAQE